MPASAETDQSGNSKLPERVENIHSLLADEVLEKLGTITPLDRSAVLALDLKYGAFQLKESQLRDKTSGLYLEAVRQIHEIRMAFVRDRDLNNSAIRIENALTSAIDKPALMDTDVKASVVIISLKEKMNKGVV